MAGVEQERELLVRDYVPLGRKSRSGETVLGALDQISAGDLLDLGVLAAALGLPAMVEGQDVAVAPRGYRLLARVPRLTRPLVDRLVEHFGSLQKLLGAGVDDLQFVEGIGEARARTVREGLSRLAESSILERYV